MPPMIAVVRVSAKAGHIRAIRVMERRHDGWIRGVSTMDELNKHPSQTSRRGGTWYAPHNVISLHDETKSYDYNGIEPGTLVNFWGDQVGIVTERRGAQYTVLDPSDGGMRQISHDGVVPVMQPTHQGE